MNTPEKFICKNCGCNEYNTTLKSNQLVARCKNCDTFWKNIPYAVTQKLYFGKYKDRDISSMITPKEREYLIWLLNNAKISKTLQTAIINHLESKKND